MTGLWWRVLTAYARHRLAQRVLVALLVAPNVEAGMEHLVKVSKQYADKFYGVA